MSTAAVDPVASLHHAAGESPALVEPNPGDGHGLPVPQNAPSASLAAFTLAVPGSCVLVIFTCLALTQIGRGASLTLWSTGLFTAWSVYLPALLFALWASEVRGEWGRT